MTDDNLAVTQEAREAAADWFAAQGSWAGTGVTLAMRRGEHDNHSLVQAFARFEAQARLAGERAGKWQDIASAPKDGTDFVALIPRPRRRLNGRGSWRVLECYWERGMKVPRFIWQGWSTDEGQPVFWMPLPKPPAILKEAASTQGAEG